jgi:acyl-CoA synthetase (NDP forming)
MDNGMMVKALHALLADDGVDIIICIAFFAPPSISDTLIQDISGVVKGCPKPVLVFTEYGPYTEQYLKEFYENGVIGFPSVSRTVRAARFLVERGRFLSHMAEDDGQQ